MRHISEKHSKKEKSHGNSSDELFRKIVGVELSQFPEDIKFCIKHNLNLVIYKYRFQLEQKIQQEEQWKQQHWPQHYQQQQKQHQHNDSAIATDFYHTNPSNHVTPDKFRKPKFPIGNISSNISSHSMAKSQP